MSLQQKHPDKRTRIIYSDNPDVVKLDVFAGKVFAVIGPFDGFRDKQDLQGALMLLLRGYNLEDS